MFSNEACCYDEIIGIVALSLYCSWDTWGVENCSENVEIENFLSCIKIYAQKYGIPQPVFFPECPI